MSRFSKMRLVAAFAVFCLLPWDCCGEETVKHLSIGILPCNDFVRNFKKFNPLINYLEKNTGFKIKLNMISSLSVLRSSLENGTVDFVLQDPQTYVETQRLYNRETLLVALTYDGSVYQRGLIIVRKDSNIQNINDLRNRTVMFGPKLSATKWIAAKKLFIDNDIDPDRALRSYSNGGCCEDIAFSVFLKAVDAGVVCDHFLKSHPESQRDLGIKIEQLAVVATTEPVFTRVFAASKHMGVEDAARVESVLLGLRKDTPEHARILEPAELGGFRRAEEEDLEALRSSVVE